MSAIYPNALQTRFRVANTMNHDQTAPRGSSLICVHIVRNIGYLGTEAGERAVMIVGKRVKYSQNICMCSYNMGLEVFYIGLSLLHVCKQRVFCRVHTGLKST